MFRRHLLRLVRGKPRVDATALPLTPVDRRRETRKPMFREAELTIEGYYRIRAIITDISPRGARISYATRVDLPARIVICEPGLKLHRWARVVWQDDGAAGLEFQEEI